MTSAMASMKVVSTPVDRRAGVVTKACASAYPDPLRFSAGERLRLHPERKSQWAGWVWCESGAGIGGWVPRSWMETEGRWGRALRDYDATELTAGERECLVIEEEECGWLLCRNEGRRGWVPAEHVRLMKARIRSAAEGDVPAITEIYNQAILRSTATFDAAVKDPGERCRWLEGRGPQHPVLVAEEGGDVVGWASLDPWSDRSAYDATAVDTLHVREDARGRGVGMALLAVLMDCARRSGIHTVLARIASGNEASVRLHERFGFRTVGVMREVGRKFGRLLDVHLMQKLFE